MITFFFSMFSCNFESNPKKKKKKTFNFIKISYNHSVGGDR